MPKFGSFDEVSQEALAYFDSDETLQKAYDLLTEAACTSPSRQLSYITGVTAQLP